ATHAVSSVSFTVTGYCSSNTTSAVQPCAEAMPSAMRAASVRKSATDSSDSVRTVAPSEALGGITLAMSPALSWVTDRTTGSNTSNLRVTIVCRATTISASAGTGSTAANGCDL